MRRSRGDINQLLPLRTDSISISLLTHAITESHTLVRTSNSRINSGTHIRSFDLQSSLNITRYKLPTLKEVTNFKSEEEEVQATFPRQFNLHLLQCDKPVNSYYFIERLRYNYRAVVDNALFCIQRRSDCARV